MSIFTELTTEAEAALKAAGIAIETFVVTEAQKAVVILKQQDITTRALNLISAIASKSLTGTQKMTVVITDLESDYAAFVAAGGLKGLLAEGESVLRQFAQSVYDDFSADVAKAGTAVSTAATHVAASV